MRRKKIKPNYRKTILRLPDLDHSKSSVLNSLGSPGSHRAYGFAIDRFTAQYCFRTTSRTRSSGRASTPASLESLGLAASTIK